MWYEVFKGRGNPSSPIFHWQGPQNVLVTVPFSIDWDQVIYHTGSYLVCAWPDPVELSAASWQEYHLAHNHIIHAWPGYVEQQVNLGEEFQPLQAAQKQDQSVTLQDNST